MGEQGEPRGAEFGARELQFVPFAQLEFLTQTRQTYLEEDLRALEDSINVDESGRYNLLHPLQVARLDRDHYRAYLIEHARFFQLPIPEFPDESADTLHHVVIAGHRRGIVIGRIGEREGLTPELMLVIARIRTNVTFDEALRDQIRENVHEKPPVYEEAVVAARYYMRRVAQIRGEHGPEVMFSYKACAHEMGWGEDRLRAACRFDELPEEIKQLVRDGDLSYSIGVELWKLRAAYIVRKDRQGTPLPDGFVSVQAWADYETVTRTRLLIRDRLVGNGQRERSFQVIRGWIDMLNVRHDQLELSLDVVETPQGRRVVADRALARVAINAIALIGVENLPGDLQRGLAELVATIRPGMIPANEQLSFGE